MTRPNPGRVAPEHRRAAGAPAAAGDVPAAGVRADGDRGTARIAVDLLGGDHAPDVVVDGALRACQADPALHLMLAGPAEQAGAVTRALNTGDRDRVTALPWRPERGWAESAVRAAVLAVGQGQADAVVSAGHTGATVTSAALGLGRLPGVRRPPLAAVLPTATGRIILLDVGSSIDPDAATLALHARLGAAFAAVVLGVTAPRVGLLTIGTEPGKGDRLRRELPPLLAGLDLPAGGRYAGLVEGNDVVDGGSADVIVTDGFTGNVLLKALETAYGHNGIPDPAAVSPPRAALLLGVSGTVVVCHGSATGADLAAGIGFAAQLHRRAAIAAMADLIEAQRGVLP